MSTIYDKIGGRPALEAVVPAFYDKVLANAELAPFFAGTNMSRLIGRQVEFFAAALGGPEPYRGPSMRQVHQGRGIRQRHFDLVAGHLAETLREAGVAEELVEPARQQRPEPRGQLFARDGEQLADRAEAEVIELGDGVVVEAEGLAGEVNVDGREFPLLPRTRGRGLG